MTEQVDTIVQTLINIGSEHDRTPAQVAVAWILDHPEITAPSHGADFPNMWMRFRIGGLAITPGGAEVP